MKKKTLLVLVILLIMAAIVALLALLNRPPAELIRGQVSITATLKDQTSATADEDTTVQFSAEDILSLPAEEFRHDIASASGGDSSGLWTGVALSALLDQAAPGWQENYTTVAAWAEDGYNTAFTVSEAAATGNIYVCYLLDGEELGAMDEGGTGPFRLVVREDEFGTRCITSLSQLELR